MTHIFGIFLTKDIIKPNIILTEQYSDNFLIKSGDIIFKPQIIYNNIHYHNFNNLEKNCYKPINLPSK